MTKKQAIRKAKRLSKKQDRELFVVYDINFENYAICTVHDLDTFYATETPVFSTED